MTEVSASGRLIELPPDLARRDKVRREAIRVGSITHEGLARITGANIVPGGVQVDYEVPQPVQAVPDTLDSATAIAILARIAGGLAMLHDANLAHGGVRRESCLVGAWDPEYAVLVGWQPGGTAEGDVVDFAELAIDLLPAGCVGSDIAQALVLAADPDPQVRPGMARLAGVLERHARRPRESGAVELPASPPATRAGDRRPVADALPDRLPAATQRVKGSGRHARQNRRAPSRREAGPDAERRDDARVPGWRAWRALALAGFAGLLVAMGISAVRAAGSDQCAVAQKVAVPRVPLQALPIREVPAGQARTAGDAATTALRESPHRSSHRAR